MEDFYEMSTREKQAHLARLDNLDKERSILYREGIDVIRNAYESVVGSKDLPPGEYRNMVQNALAMMGNYPKEFSKEIKHCNQILSELTS